jgi:hypothetical protein
MSISKTQNKQFFQKKNTHLAIDKKRHRNYSRIPAVKIEGIYDRKSRHGFK